MEKRRRTVRLDAALALALVLAQAGAGALACEMAGAKRLQGKAFDLAYRSAPAKVPAGSPFVVEILVCPRSGAAAPATLKADAHMPEHRHGMNYKPSVSAQAGGRFRSEGWLFHMPGRWEFIFEVGGERITDSVRIE